MMSDAVQKPPKASRAKTAAAHKPLVRTTLSERTYEAIKERVFDQLLAPGTRLNIDGLSRELNVSSSPVREALARLAVERLVVLEGYSGYRVAPEPTAKYLTDLLDYRMLTEGHCAQMGAARKSQEDVTKLRRLIERMQSIPLLGTRYREYRRFVDYDAQFHQLLVDSAGNEVISQTYASLNAIIVQSRLYLNREGGSTSSDQVVKEHKAILKAYEAGDGDAAKRAICEHLEGGRRRLLDRM